MEKKNISKFPEGFFTKNRKEISIKKALKDIIPVEWTKQKKEEKSLKENKKLSLN